MDLRKELRDLESKAVFIHLSYDHYQAGTNCLFSIEFRNFVDDNQRPLKTGWYSDGHEFGDTVDCIETAILFANWLLEQDHLKWYFYRPEQNMTERAETDFLKSIRFRKLANDKIFQEFNRSKNKK